MGAAPGTDRPGKGALFRLQATALVVWLGAAAATYLLASGWTSNACLAAANGQSNAACAAVSLGLIGAAWLLFALAVFSVVQDRRQVMAGTGDPAERVRRGGRGVRWSAVFAIGLSVLLFADCSGSIVSGTQGSMADAAQFWSLAPWLIVPMAIVLAAPAGLAAIAQAQLAQRSPSAARTAVLATWSIALVVLVGLTTAVAGLVIGIPTCYIFSSSPSSQSPSVCAAGVGSIANIFSSGASLALFLPYLLIVNSAIGRIHADT